MRDAEQHRSVLFILHDPDKSSSVCFPVNWQYRCTCITSSMSIATTSFQAEGLQNSEAASKRARAENRTTGNRLRNQSTTSPMGVNIRDVCLWGNVNPSFKRLHNSVNSLLSLRAGSGVPVQQLSPHWRNILNVFDGLLETLKAANVPQFLVKKLFQQLFSFVNVQLFNQLLLRRECCSFNNGESRVLWQLLYMSLCPPRCCSTASLWQARDQTSSMCEQIWYPGPICKWNVCNTATELVFAHVRRRVREDRVGGGRGLDPCSWQGLGRRVLGRAALHPPGAS